MSANKGRVKAETTFKKEGANLVPQARVPNLVREHLGARHGDRLLFVEGSIRAVEEAAMRGSYFVVRLERAVVAAEAEEGAAEEVPLSAGAVAVRESLEEAVRKRLEAKSRYEGGGLRD